MKVIIIAKKNKPFVKEILLLTKKIFKNLIFFDAEKKIDVKSILNLNYDIIISYISDYVLSDKILKKTKLYNINFHPGPPDYPGYGCFNFALYNKAKYYGCTAHLMNKKVDTGKIIDVRNFKLKKNESVLTLSDKTYKHMYFQFKNIINHLAKKKKIKLSNIKWTRKPYKKKQLEKLCKLELNMSKSEVDKRIMATSYPNKPGAYLNFKGNKFVISE